DPTYFALALLRQAYLEWARGELAGAAALCREGLEMAHQAGYLLGVAEGLEALAVVSGGLGQPERAARALGAAESRRARNAAGMGRSARPSRLVLIDRAIVTLRATLGDEEYASAFDAGRAQALDEAVAEALS